MLFLKRSAKWLIIVIKELEFEGAEAVFGHNGTMSKDSTHTYTYTYAYREDGFDEGLRWMYEILEGAERRQRAQKLREMGVKRSVIKDFIGWRMLVDMLLMDWGWHERMKIYFVVRIHQTEWK
jgi:hypothetical protein